MDQHSIKNTAQAQHRSRFFQNLVVGAAVGCIRAYQWAIRPHLLGACKFCPTCSEYAIEALSTHGVRRGAWMALRRLGRCHPFSPGGIDLVCPPDQRVSTSSHAS